MTFCLPENDKKIDYPFFVREINKLYTIDEVEIDSFLSDFYKAIR